MQNTKKNLSTGLIEKRFVFMVMPKGPSEAGAPPIESADNKTAEKPGSLDTPKARNELYAKAREKAEAMQAENPELAKKILANIDQAIEQEASGKEEEVKVAMDIARSLERTLARIATPAPAESGKNEPLPTVAQLEQIGTDYVAQISGESAPETTAKKGKAESEKAALDKIGDEYVATISGQPVEKGPKSSADYTPATAGVLGTSVPDLGPAETQPETQPKKPESREQVRVAQAPTAQPSTPYEAVAGGSGKAPDVAGPRVAEAAAKGAESQPAVPPDVQTAANQYAGNPDKFPPRIEGSDGNTYSFKLEKSTSGGVEFTRATIVLEGKKTGV